MLKDKHIIITGASRGIGRAVAFEAAKNGARVGVNYRTSENNAQDIVKEIESAGFPRPMLLRFDAGDNTEIERGVEIFINAFGRIDGWVNNAAVNLPGLLPVLSEEEIRAQIDSALFGAHTLLPVHHSPDDAEQKRKHRQHRLCSYRESLSRAVGVRGGKRGTALFYSCARV